MSEIAADHLNDRTSLRWCAAGLVLLVLLAYGPTLSSDFIQFDDPQYVIDNPLVRAPSWSGVVRFFGEVRKPSTVAGYYQPLTMLSLMIDSMISGGVPSPRIFHLHNVLLHGLTSVLVMLLLRRVVGGLGVPFILAMLFALHPVQVESVAWISQRKTVLATPLGIGCLLCYLEFGRGRRASWMWGSLACYLLANLAKPTIVLLPLVLPLLDAWPLGRRVGPSLKEKWPFAVVMVVMGYVAFASQSSSVATVGVPNLDSAAVVWKWIALLSFNVMLYAGNIVWPLQLSPFRDVPTSLALTHPPILMAVFITLGLTVVWILSWRLSKPLFVGLGSFFIVLAPALGPVRFFDSCVADRFLYFPLVFLLLPVAAGIVRMEARSTDRVHLLRYAVTILALPAIILMRAQQAIWRDSLSFWTYVVASVPDYGIGQQMLAQTFMDDGRLEEAVAHAERAVELRPMDSQAHALRSRITLHRGDRAGAVEKLRQATTLPLLPDAADVYAALAEALAATGEVEQAKENAVRAVTLGVDATRTYQRVGDAAMQLGKRFDAAAGFYREAIKATPRNAMARWNLGTALEAQGDMAAALAEYEIGLAHFAQVGPPPAQMVEKVAGLRHRGAATSRPTGR
ncbi:MAG: tetratricopeptide repeat protein [Planctomycetota bacterium]